MDYIIGAISIVSLVFNYLIYKCVTATYPLGSIEELEPINYTCCCEVVVKPPEYLEQEDPPPPPQKVEAHQAWVNRQQIPWVPPAKPPEPLIKAPNRPPLARPEGFV